MQQTVAQSRVELSTALSQDWTIADASGHTVLPRQAAPKRAVESLTEYESQSSLKGGDQPR